METDLENLPASVTNKDIHQLTIIEQTKLDDVELAFDEVLTNLTKSADDQQVSINELTFLARASQNAVVYKVLADSIRANNETNRDMIAAAKAKQALVISRRTAGQSTDELTDLTKASVGSMTTTELVDLIRNSDGIYTNE